MKRTPPLWNVVLLGAVLWFAVPVSPAAAALNLCNRTSYVLYAGTGEVLRSGIVTHGWTRIAPGACETAIAGPLAPSAYYVYARTSQAHSGSAHVWGGPIRMCVMNTDFSLATPVGSNRCTSDDAFEAPFARVFTQGAPSWNATFTLSPEIASLTDARDAGIARLLSDIGYKTGAGGGGTAAALNRFRIRMKMPAGASDADLFDALETEAMKIAAPAGYSICNDTDAAVWAAVGFGTGAKWLSRGWWKVAPGACARAIATRLSAGRVYLLVERAKNKKLVSGSDVFCVADITFEIQGRDHCAARGLTEAGFARTDTKGLAGFAAHVGETGLLPPPRAPD